MKIKNFNTVVTTAMVKGKPCVITSENDISRLFEFTSIDDVKVALLLLGEVLPIPLLDKLITNMKAANNGGVVLD